MVRGDQRSIPAQTPHRDHDEGPHRFFQMAINLSRRELGTHLWPDLSPEEASDHPSQGLIAGSTAFIFDNSITHAGPPQDMDNEPEMMGRDAALTDTFYLRDRFFVMLADSVCDRRTLEKYCEMNHITPPRITSTYHIG